MFSHQLHPSCQLATMLSTRQQDFSLQLCPYLLLIIHLLPSSYFNSFLIIVVVFVCCCTTCMIALWPEATAELSPGQTPCRTVLTGPHIPVPTALSLHPNPHCTVPACCHVYNGAGATDFSSLNGRPGSDAAFLDLLKAQTGPTLAGGKGNHPTHAQLSKLDLQENDVAKVHMYSSVNSICSPAKVTQPISSGSRLTTSCMCSFDMDAQGA